MKKSIFILVTLLISSVLYSQTIDTNFNTDAPRKLQLKQTSIEFQVDALVNDRSVKDTITVDLIYNGVRRTVKGINGLSVYLKYDINYFIEITYKDYTTKLLQIDTRKAKRAEWILTAHVYLQKSKFDTVEYAGGFAYQDNTFKSIKDE